MKVTLVDYGAGNVKSVKRAFEFSGADVLVTSDPAEVAKAERLVLPGVGAFGDCMNEIKTRGLEDPIRQFVSTGRPFLGICVGMQILLSLGEEFGEHAGFDFIEGRVKRISDVGSSGQPHVLPFIGWAPLELHNPEGSLLAGTPQGASFYFVHSFMASPADPSAILATYDYDGIKVTAAVRKNNLTGLQFHPEKSAGAGLAIIKRYLA